MSYTSTRNGKHRIVAITGVLAVHLLVLALLWNYNVQAEPQQPEQSGIVTIKLSPEQELQEEDEVAPTEAEEGASAPPNIKSDAIETEAPKPKVVIKNDNPATASPTPLDGNDRTSGAADEKGEGTGAGGEGDGTGSGDRGSGKGGGIIVTRAIKTAGEINQRDYPKGQPRRRGVEEKVVAYYTVRPNGRVTNCRIVQSSGNALLDQSTCRLIEERFRYRPARNSAGQAVADETGWQQVWWIGKRS